MTKIKQQQQQQQQQRWRNEMRDIELFQSRQRDGEMR
jgi:hypothetical protein